MKKTSPGVRTIDLPVRRLSSSSLDHQLLTLLTNREANVFTSRPSTLDVTNTVFLIYLSLFFKVIMKNSFPRIVPSSYPMQDLCLHHKTINCRHDKNSFSSLPKSFLQGHIEKYFSQDPNHRLTIRKTAVLPLHHKLLTSYALFF